MRRLGATIGELLSEDTRHERIAADLAGEGFDLRHTKYLVYYDGPVASRGLCGTGGGSFAMVYVQACAAAGAATVATHELVHALGAMRPAGAPNACPGNSGHVCDTTGDILYPFAQPAPLSSFVLDFGRNDYYGHGIGTFDVQDSPWLRRLDAPAALTISIEGGGTVSSDFPGLGCGGSCRTEWNAGTEIGLFAEPAEGQRFLGWSGVCNHTSPTCAAILGATNELTARFGPASFKLNVAVQGRGRVVGAPGFACGRRCIRNVTSFTPYTLRAQPARGWRLKSWGGACQGTRASCTVPMRRRRPCARSSSAAVRRV